jgi:DNA polymerase (family X)
MNNKEIAPQFSLLAKLMDIHGENNFKAKTYSVVAYKISQLTVALQTFSEENISKINGIGEAIAKKIMEILSTGKMKILEDLILKTPEGIFEMLNIKGLGPKKISLIWKEMGIENIGELLYACNENRLLLYKGFGKKTQDNVIESIEFYLRQQGSFLFAQVEQLALDLEKFLQKVFSLEKIKLTGDLARNAETVDELEYVIPLSQEIIIEKLEPLIEFEFLESEEDYLLYKYNEGIKIKLHPTDKIHLVKKVFETTGSADFISAFEKDYSGLDYQKAINDNDIFKQAAIQYIPAFLRENKYIISIAAANKIPHVIQPEDIKGIIHCHSNWSDGINTIEQLALAGVKNSKEYLVISDHSKAANYAQGLNEEQIKAQQQLIDELNEKLCPFKIFKSIESDILSDGNLDYSDSVLSTFDLVIASIHSNLKMNEEKAMMRLLKAIENPYTTILGHMTGRLYALSKNVLLSIDPDAHSIPEFENTRYGVLVAQKGMVTAKNNLSSFGLKDFENYLTTNRK